MTTEHPAERILAFLKKQEDLEAEIKEIEADDDFRTLTAMDDAALDAEVGALGERLSQTVAQAQAITNLGASAGASRRRATDRRVRRLGRGRYVVLSRKVVGAGIAAAIVCSLTFAAGLTSILFEWTQMKAYNKTNAQLTSRMLAASHAFYELDRSVATLGKQVASLDMRIQASAREAQEFAREGNALDHSVVERLQAVQQRVGEVDTRIASIDATLATINARLKKLETSKIEHPYSETSASSESVPTTWTGSASALGFSVSNWTAGLTSYWTPVANPTLPSGGGLAFGSNGRRPPPNVGTIRSYYVPMNVGYSVTSNAQLHDASVRAVRSPAVRQ